MTNKRGIEAGKAFVRFGVDMTSFEKGLRSARARLTSFSASAAKIGAGFGAAGALGLSPFLVGLRSLATAGDLIDKSSQRAGLAADEFQRLRFALEQSGSGGANLERLAKSLGNAVFNLNKGTKTYTDAAEALGISTNDLTSGTNVDRINLLANAYANAGDKAEALGALSVLAGRGAQALIPAANGGVDSLLRLAEQFDRLNLGDSDATVAAGRDLADSVNVIRSAFGSLVRTIGATVSPAIDALAEPIAKVVGGFKSFAESAPGVLRVVAVAATAITGVGVALGAVAAGAAALGVFTLLVPVIVSALPAFVGISAAIIGITGVLGVAGLALQDFNRETGALTAAWRIAAAVVSDALDDIGRGLTDAAAQLGDGEWTRAGESAAAGFISGFVDFLTKSKAGKAILDLLPGLKVADFVSDSLLDVREKTRPSSSASDAASGAAAGAAGAIRGFNRGTFSSDPRFAAGGTSVKPIEDVAKNTKATADDTRRIREAVEDATFGNAAGGLAFG